MIFKFNNKQHAQPATNNVMIISTYLYKKIRSSTIVVLLTFLFCNCSNEEQTNFSNAYFKIQINDQGFITSMKNITQVPYREFSPADKPSPLMQLYDGKKKIYYHPIQAKYNSKKQAFTLN